MFYRFGQAARRNPLTGAIPPPTGTGTFGCWLWPLTRSAPLYPTWQPKVPLQLPCRSQPWCGHQLNMCTATQCALTSGYSSNLASRWLDYRDEPSSPAEKEANLGTSCSCENHKCCCSQLKEIPNQGEPFASHFST